METLTSNGSIFLWRKHWWQLETTSNSHTYSCYTAPAGILNRFSTSERTPFQYGSPLKRELAEVCPFPVQRPHEEQLVTLGQLLEQSLAAATENALNAFKVFTIWFQGVYGKKTSYRITPKCFVFEFIYNYLECNCRFWNSLSLLTDAFSTTALHFAATN